MSAKLLVDPVHNLVMNFENTPVVVEELIAQLYQIGVFRSGEVDAPFFIDFRKILTYPLIVSKMAELLWEKMSSCQFQHILGTPLVGSLLASAISIKRMVPMLAEDKGMIVGDYFAGQKVILVSAFMHSGERLSELVTTLKADGLLISDAVVFMDGSLEEGNPLEKRGIRVHSILTPEDLLS